MKTRKILAITTMAVVVALNIPTPELQGEITGSAHDFTNENWSDSQICLPCHTPHGADTSVSDSPLWNHQNSTATYTLYSSATLDATPGQPTGRSALCLSCHDGTVALDSFGGNTGSEFLSAAEDAYIGTNLSDDHPVSFTFNTALATTDGTLHDPATATTGLGGTIANDFLFGGSLECASCHDVHNTYDNDGLLLVSNTGSALCLTCHDK
jgi:predicted CXXCH cytochrome family protein